MKLLEFFILSIAFLLFGSCSSFKNDLVSSGGKELAIQNAIVDFTRTSRLYKKDSVFHVSHQDTFYRMVLRKIDDVNYEWIVGAPNNEIETVTIGAASTKMLVTEETVLGSKGKLPSRYIEKNGKLFYWWDDDVPLSEEALAVFDKYNLLQDDESGSVKFPDILSNNSLEAVDYYFCRTNPSKYKKLTTKKAMGYYDAPNLECNSH